MPIIKNAILSFLMLTVSASAVSAEGSFYPGKWEIFTTMAVEGIPNPPPETHLTTTRCIAGTDPMVFLDKTPPGCGAPQLKESGNQIQYRMTCARLNLEGTLLFDGKAMTGDSVAHTSQGMIAKSHQTGKYVGPCTN